MVGPVLTSVRKGRYWCGHICPRGNLYVNGKKIANQKADDILCVIFKDVQLSEGDNRIEVRSGKVTDESTWTLNGNQ